MRKKFQVFAAIDKAATREYREEEHKFRSPFQRDRDRVLYSKEFRRLSGKTQVFVAGFDDHMRTRLTHTLEVSQIANTALRELGLNEVLGEAIALGHDLGHTPFGHIGERTLNYILNGCDGQGEFGCHFRKGTKGFKHNWQGLRTVVELENIDKRFYGLNLTDYVRWGILHHTSLKWKDCEYRSLKGKCNLRHHSEKKCVSTGLALDFYSNRYKLENQNCWSVEAVLVKYADDIAQRHHDVEDGIMAGLLDKKELLDKFERCFSSHFSLEDEEKVANIKKELERKDNRFLPMFATLIINFLTTQLIDETRRKLEVFQKKYKIITPHDFAEKKRHIYRANELNHVDIVGYAAAVKKADNEFRDFLKERVLSSHIAQAMDSKSNYIVRQLFKAYMSSPQQLPDRTVSFIFKNYDQKHYVKIMNQNVAQGTKYGMFRGDLKDLHDRTRDNSYKITLLRTICDYIAGMTDKYAIEQYELLYGTTHYDS